MQFLHCFSHCLNSSWQKDLLEKERAKKEEELNKKKRKEQEKQAKFNKALAVAQAAINLGVAVTAALTVAPPASFAFAALTAAIAAVQLAAVIATPIPKYKMGRKGGPKELAYVGDGGVHEVIERKSGEVEITPNKDTLVQLMQGDNVYLMIFDMMLRRTHGFFQYPFEPFCLHLLFLRPLHVQ